MERALKVINELQSLGVIDKYAIGGAMAAMYYCEPISTYDLDIFLILPQSAGGVLTLEPIYTELRRRGYTEDFKESIVIEGYPVQFLPAYDSLVEEALNQAVQVRYNETPTWICRIEHLMAICLKKGRDKDRSRVALFRTQSKWDEERLADILKRFNLESEWQKWIN